MYSISSIVIALTLFTSMLVCNQLGFIIGKRAKAQEDSELKGQTSAIQTGIMGLLALLLGFTFNMSIQRYDARNNMVMEESNAINHFAIRLQALDTELHKPVYQTLSEYVELRQQLAHTDLIDVVSRRAMHKQITEIQKDVLRQLGELHEPRVSQGLQSGLVAAFAQLIQAEQKRTALLRLHVPEPILFLLFGIFLSAGGMLGYTSGLGNKRPKVPTLIMSALISTVVFIIIDLDRPKRGLIQVNQSSLEDTAELVAGYWQRPTL